MFISIKTNKTRQYHVKQSNFFNMNLKYIFLFLVLSQLCFFNLLAQTRKNMTISGYIKDKNNGEALIGATVFIEDLKTGTISNQYGFFSVSLPKGTYKIVIRYIGYQQEIATYELTNDKTINFELRPVTQSIQGVEITADRKDENVRKAEMSSIKMDIKKIKKIPALFGEVDILKSIQLLPGIQSAAEGTSGFSVRGGSPDQNLILLDEATVYNPSHLLGFFSVFNNDAIKDIQIYKGDIPAMYGGRLSSLLEVRMKEGNSKRFTATGGIGAIASRLTLEGPIIKEQSSWIVSGRRTYIDLFFPLAANEGLHDSKLFFYDLNAKVNHTINENNRIFVSAYSGRDVFGGDFAQMNLGNKTFTARWNHLFSKKLFSNFTIVRAQYDYELGTPEGEAQSFLWNSSIVDYGVKGDFTWFLNPNNTLKFGAGSTFHDFKPGKAKGTGSESFISEYVVPENFSIENSLYVSNDQQLSGLLNLKYGIRISSFQNIGPSTNYTFNNEGLPVDSVVHKKNEFYNTKINLEPRLAASLMINELSSVKASVSRTVQYLHLAQNSTAGSPLDIWFPSSPNVKPQVADQFALGYFRNFANNNIETSIEVYYKKMTNTIDFKDHADLLLNQYMEAELRYGKSWSYGTEILIRKTTGQLTGWIGYTLSKSERKINGVNNNNTYKSPYDRTHEIAVVANYELSDRISLSANWVYSTGAPYTIPTGRAEIGGIILPVYSDRNEYRMPDYHRLDLSMSLKGKEKTNQKFRHEWNFSVYNAYARKNAWIINFIQDENDPYKTYAEKIYLFSIIPSVTFNFFFN